MNWKIAIMALVALPAFGQTKWSDMGVETTFADGDWLMMLDASDLPGAGNQRAAFSTLRDWWFSSDNTISLGNGLAATVVLTGNGTGTDTTLTFGNATAGFSHALTAGGNAVVTAGDTGSVTSTMILDGTVASGDILNNTVTATDLAATLTFANTDYLDLGAMYAGTDEVRGIRLPNVGATPIDPDTLDEGFLGWDESGARLMVNNGAAWVPVGGDGGVVADTDLAGGTALSVNTGYFDTFSANRTFSALPAGTDGDQILLVFDVTGAARDLNFHTNSTVYRTGESGALAAALNFDVGYHKIILEKSDGRWQLTDSALDSETQNTIYAAPSGGNGKPTFRALAASDIPNDLIDSQHYAAGSIENEHIADDAVGLAEMAAGTDGELITWDASGNPAVVAVGTAGHVLTSNGAGAAPTFQAAAGGGTLLVNKVQDSNATTTPADITELTFSATADTNYLLRFDLLIDVAGGGGSIGIGVDVPAGATLTGMTFTHAGTQTHSADDTPIASGGVDVLMRGSVYVDLAGTAGTVALRFEEINAATTVNIMVGSSLEYVIVP